MAVGRTTRRETTRYVKVPAGLEYRIASPTLIFCKERKKVVRWPARPTFPEGPGIAVPGMCPTASRSVRASSPSSTLVARPRTGISIFPTVAGGRSAASGVVAFGWTVLATGGLSVARADMPAATNPAATIAALRTCLVIRKVMHIIRSFQPQTRQKKTVPVLTAFVGRPGDWG